MYFLKSNLSSGAATFCLPSPTEAEAEIQILEVAAKRPQEMVRRPEEVIEVVRRPEEVMERMEVIERMEVVRRPEEVMERMEVMETRRPHDKRPLEIVIGQRPGEGEGKRQQDEREGGGGKRRRREGEAQEGGGLSRFDEVRPCRKLSLL